MSNSVPSAGNGTLSNAITGTATPASNPGNDAKADATPDPSTTAADESHLPKRWRGKSEAERVESFKTLESELGRKNNEVGQLRYAIDQMLQMQRAGGEPSGKAPKAKDEPVTGERLLTDPTGTIESVAERIVGKTSKDVQDRLDKIEYDSRKEVFAKKFPKFEETMADDDFIDWVKSTPHRQRLAASAASRGDFDAAEELFGLYEDVRKVKEASVTGSDQKAKAAAADAKTLRPGNGGAGKRTASAAPAGKTFKRSELTKLYMHDRDAYNAMGTEIRAAYAGGRVTND